MMSVFVCDDSVFYLLFNLIHYFYVSLYLGMILTDKRARLTGDFFEDLILLHMNDDDDYDEPEDDETMIEKFYG